ERIDTVSNAMELRGFGKKNKRSWYSSEKLKTSDSVIIIFSILFTIIALFITFHDGSRFYNPFI
ncbi:MAG: energy-coupling factor transporter transmembrane protein EcfT, partial [Treponema sp.]|nr:energy-coupling factor transporter transmembrane protein EcfT [Treponema sp.]